MTQSYIEYLRPGIFFANTYSEPIDHRDPERVEVPNDVIGFRFYDQVEIEHEGMILRSERHNISGWYYIGKELRIENVMRDMQEMQILISNMKCNNIERVVITSSGNCYPLYEDDVVLKNGV